MPFCVQEEIHMGKFTYRTPGALLDAAKAAGYDLPFSEDLSVLAAPVTVEGSNVTLKNRLTVHPMEGFDSTLDGAPGELTGKTGSKLYNS